ncbi:DUF6443 domain-containing protein [Chryseobacterium lathyri]|jgi:RHS repeat-associated protein|uniref:DUF6443 domain-containing protein n=1 Tax=Chryseobacterium lathyri TaxID=395933 RepID=A0A511Y5X5_9FLAO|nr:DUF6443 domain-containing protein [Chryseobacterium lathyri]GEN70602.1 hypothetical protein CLA01_06740 [Chryseobacterium lathyri]
MYKKIYISIGLILGIYHYGQVVLNSPPVPNTEKADPQSIRMLPGFSFNSVSGTFRAYIGGSSSNNPGNTYTPITVDYSTNISNTENYVYTRQYLVPTEVSNGSLQQIQSVQFFDGLGRPKQSVSIKSTPTGKDLVTHIPYDGFGRQVDSWLPVPMSSQNGNIQTAVEGSTNAYYQSNGINDSFPFSHQNLENSPLDRLLSQKNPGTDWQNKPVTFGYDTNVAGEVKKYATVTNWVDGATSSVLSTPGTYGEAQLYKNTVTDEDNGKTIEYKNGKGQTLLVRKVISSSENADTYYVYNEYDQLAFVIPPLASASASISTTALDHLCYQYKYDGRNRLVEKKLPGKGPEQMVYNKKDQIVLYRDIVLKNGIPNFTADNSWTFTKYDQFGRVVYTGISRDGTSRQNIQTYIDNQPVSASYETRGGNLVLNGMNIGYGNVSYPTSIDKVLSVNYYDTYPDASTIPATILGQEVLLQDVQSSNVSTKSLPTASYVKNVENDNWTKTYTYYDRKGRVISTYSVNHLGGYTKTESLLKFSGSPEYTLTEHKRAADGTKVNIKETFEYDHQERLVRHWHQVNGGAQELLAENLYNDLGQIQTKNVGNTTGSALQNVKYAYNIRGWLTKLNEPSDLQNKLFAYELRYNRPDSQFSGSARYNGNISQMSWITQSDAVMRNYSYEYDSLNRLKEGRFWDAMNLDRGEYHEQFTYDLNGNIKTLLRRGKQLPGYTAPEVMDNLEYHYENGEQSNKLTYLKEVGTGNALSGYPLSSGSTGSTIIYDLNGNMTVQQDKGISSIQYNYLNLPEKITQNSKITDYTYRADGVKVKKIFGTDTTDYLDGFQYENGTLKFLPTAEGYFNFETGKYVYNYTDHLGNVRLSYFKNGSGAEIIEESNYYPFGLKHEGYNVLSGNPAYKYKYNGKELQETGMYDYGFRQYMPDLGRWSSLDPLSELASSWTSYRYAYDNPLRYIDPKGLFESRKEARQYRREHDLHGSIKKQKDGSYAINDRDNMISYAKGNDSDLTASDAHDNDGVVESVLVTKAPYSQKDAFDLTTTDISLFENITWKGMSTAQKSKFVWDAKKIIKTTTGLKIPGSTSSWYRAKIPKAMKGIGVAGGAVAGAVIIYDVVDSKQIKASNILDAAVTGVSFVPGWGWVVGGVFFGADMVTKGITGQSIGDHLDNYIEEKYDKDDGALIDWSKK